MVRQQMYMRILQNFLRHSFLGIIKTEFHFRNEGSRIFLSDKLPLISRLKPKEKYFEKLYQKK